MSIFENIKNSLTNTSKEKKISIIMPVYNCEKYLRECIDSLLNQTMEEIEIICIDDESTDNSYSILKEYSKKDRRIRVYKQKHSNAGNARNLGLSKAKGKYVLFLDSDDFFANNLCETTYKNAILNDIDILLFNAKIYDDKTKEYSDSNALLDKTFIEPEQVYNSYALKEHLFHITAPNPWTKLYKKEFIEDNELEFQSLTNSNDLLFTRLSLTVADRIMAIDEKLVNYRVNTNDSTQDNKHKQPLNFIKAFKALKEELEKRGIYQFFKQTYINSFVTTFVYNYTTNSDKAKEEILTYLKDGGLESLGLSNIDEKSIYASTKYKEFKEIFAKGEK